ncbi:MAG: biotin synthase BioB [Oscillospiraceae bacterium]|nr:biotin synthase BioB [Oscillospiraceae bacterium]
MIALAEEIVGGKRLKKGDDTSAFLTSELSELCRGADRIRSALCGKHADLCGIINGRSGKCPENCKFCAQSVHNHTGIKEYGFLDENIILEECKHYEKKGVHRFSIVTAGRTLSDEDFEKAISAYRLMHSECGISLCASHGLLTEEQFKRLYDSGVRMYHANIETSRRNFPNICTSHSFDDKIACIKRAQKCGFKVCSGGIIGMGETWEDRLDMAFTLAELNITSIPINALTPINGTPLEKSEKLSESDILRTVAIFRYINPTAYIRLAAGRNLMEDSGKAAFRAGANATITGDMLTTSGNDINADMEMLSGMGFEIAKA